MKENRRAKGLAYQRWVKAWIEENMPGSIVHNQPMNHFCIAPGKWVCRSNDILGCIDVIAIVPNGKPMFIQCTMDGHIEKRFQELIKVPWSFWHTDVELWVKNKKGATVCKRLMQVNGKLILADISRIERRKKINLSDSGAGESTEKT